MSTTFDMRKLSDTTEQGILSAWLVDEGEAVSAGDIIAQVETGKATIDLEASHDGILLKKVIERNAVPVGDPVAVLCEKDKDTPETAVGNDGAEDRRRRFWRTASNLTREETRQMKNSISNGNVHSILETYFQNRFNDLSPSDFEALVTNLMSRKFDAARTTKKSGDFGADVIATKGNKKIVVEVKRYKKGNNVGNSYVNNLIAAKDYYDADACIFVTTSDFTRAARTIAKRSGVELWNWNRLTEEISEHFWDGKDYYRFYSTPSSSVAAQSSSQKQRTAAIDVRASRLEHGTTGKGSHPVNWIYIDITNKSDEVIAIETYAPKVVTSSSRQYDVDGRQSGYFSSGRVYPGATVTASFYLRRQKAGKLSQGDKLYFEVRRTTTTGMKRKQYDLKIPNSSYTSDGEENEVSDVVVFLAGLLFIAIVVFGIIAGQA